MVCQNSGRVAYGMSKQSVIWQNVVDINSYRITPIFTTMLVMYEMISADESTSPGTAAAGQEPAGRAVLCGCVALGRVPGPTRWTIAHICLWLWFPNRTGWYCLYGQELESTVGPEYSSASRGSAGCKSLSSNHFAKPSWMI
jgi:hypothetical protein